MNYFSGDKIPDFLFEECLELRRDLWKGLHKPISVRWEILQKVHDKTALEAVLKDGDRRLKKKCKLIEEPGYPNFKIPYINKSFYQLIMKRCLELK